MKPIHDPSLTEPIASILKACDESDKRMSDYTPEQRAELEREARATIAGSKTEVQSATKQVYVPRIVSAAMLMEDGLIVPGVRHFSPDMRAVLKRIYGEGYHLKVKEQGFIDSKGSFLSREAAWKIADGLGQIRIYHPRGPEYGPSILRAAGEGDEGDLFSENLY